MARRIIALVALLALSVSGVALAAKPKPKTKKVKTSGTIYANVIPGPKALAAGTFDDRKLQGGSIVFQLQATSGDPGTTHITSKRVALYTTKGALTGSAKVDLVTPSGSGPSTFENGSFTFNKGTGSYKHWKFKGTFTGTLSDSGYSFKYKGTLTEPKK